MTLSCTVSLSLGDPCDCFLEQMGERLGMGVVTPFLVWSRVWDIMRERGS